MLLMFPTPSEKATRWINAPTSRVLTRTKYQLEHRPDRSGYTPFLYRILTYLHDTYPELKEIYITENGFSAVSDCKKTARMVCADDNDRIKYHQDHLVNILKAMKDKVFDKVKGYYVWTFCDNYEWGGGYTVRFGLVYIDYINSLTRYPKDSCAWFAKFLKSDTQPPKWYKPWWKPTLLDDREHAGLRIGQVKLDNPKIKIRQIKWKIRSKI